MGQGGERVMCGDLMSSSDLSKAIWDFVGYFISAADEVILTNC